MRITGFIVLVLMSGVLVSTCACANYPQGGDQEGESEETGPRLVINETYDAVRNGVRLVLAWDSASSSFVGTVENVTEQTISSVRIEVHLSNGTELGPTIPVDLTPGDQTDVKLSAAGQSFSWWKAHAETSEGREEHETGDEHGGGGE